MIIFQEDGSPYSTNFDDIYFDTSAGFAQSKSVFLDGNNIDQQLKNAAKQFTIAETGFGSGLNFILTLQTYQKLFTDSLDAAPKLTFISTEKYPLSYQQLEQTWQLWPELASLAAPLLAQYKTLSLQQSNEEKKEEREEEQLEQVQACQLSFLAGKVELEIHFADAAKAFSQLGKRKQRLVNAWYLDGFSPAKNPEMWSEALFKQIERLSKEQATLATFTTSGMVRRELISHGFRVYKQNSGGKKHEHLAAVFQQSDTFNKGYQLRPRITKPQHVAIIGGGIASACAAYALTTQGVKVTLYCQDNKLAQGASSNAIGALYPLLHQQQDNISLFYQAAFNRAKSLYQSLIEQGFDFEHQWCGLLEVSYKSSLQKRQALFEQLDAWPKTLIHGVDKNKASEHANIALEHGGLFMPEAGWISPQSLVTQLFAAAEKTNRLRIEFGCKIKQLEQLPNSKWQLHADRKSYTESVVVVCAGADSLKINTINKLPLTSVRGQVSVMNTNQHIEKLTTVICHKGYLTPANKAQHCIGATFEKNSFDCQPRQADDDYNLAMLEQCLPTLAESINWQTSDIKTSRARLRCMTPDHLPVVGAMPDINAHIESYDHLRTDKNWRYQTPAPCIDNLYLISGLGARGLCSAPLLADILAADICGTPYPVDNEQLFNLAPNRFVIRDLVKRKI